jgi:hypothetical protein
MLVHQPVITSQSEIAIVPAGGTKRTLRGHSLMSPFDPTATSAERPQLSFPTGIDAEVQMSDSLIVGRVNRAARTILEARRTGALLDTLAPIDQPQSDIGPRPHHVPLTSKADIGTGMYMDAKPLLSEFSAFKLKNLCHFVLAARAFIGTLITSPPAGKDMDQYHSCAAFGTRRTSDHAWRIANIRSHSFLPTLQFGRARPIRFSGLAMITPPLN